MSQYKPKPKSIEYQDIPEKAASYIQHYDVRIGTIINREYRYYFYKILTNQLGHAGKSKKYSSKRNRIYRVGNDIYVGGRDNYKTMVEWFYYGYELGIKRGIHLIGK